MSLDRELLIQQNTMSLHLNQWLYRGDSRLGLGILPFTKPDLFLDEREIMTYLTKTCNQFSRMKLVQS